MLPLHLTIGLGMVSTTKDCMRSKGVPKLRPELCSELWVSITDHFVRQAKLSGNTLEKQLCNLFGTQLPYPQCKVTLNLECSNSILNMLV